MNPSRFVPTMVRLASSEFPLRRFSAASTYEGLKGKQKDWFDIDTTLKEVFASWEKAWTLDRFDPVRALAVCVGHGPGGDNSVVVRAGVGGDMGVLFDLRTLARLELVGTRQRSGCWGDIMCRVRSRRGWTGSARGGWTCSKMIRSTRTGWATRSRRCGTSAR